LGKVALVSKTDRTPVTLGLLKVQLLPSPQIVRLSLGRVAVRDGRHDTEAEAVKRRV
jgi:hypothetical protein